MTLESLACVDCAGQGKQLHFCSYAWFVCPACLGSGKVMRDEAWMLEGDALRHARAAANLSLRQMARALGVELVELSAMERGMQAPPAKWREKALEIRG
jgi:hypothetical protein